MIVAAYVSNAMTGTKLYQSAVKTWDKLTCAGPYVLLIFQSLLLLSPMEIY